MEIEARATGNSLSLIVDGEVVAWITDSGTDRYITTFYDPQSRSGLTASMSDDSDEQ